MPRQITSGSSVATYSMTHPLLSRPMAVTCGHSLLQWDGTYVEAADALFQKFADAIMPGIDTNVTFTGVSLYIGNNDEPSGSVESTETAVAGEAAGNYPPPNTALLVRKASNFFGRTATGRMFLPFIVPEANIDEGGFVDGAVLGPVQTQLNNWYGLLTSEDVSGNGSLPPVLNPQPSAPGGPPAAPIAIVGFSAQNKVATQRRRLRR